MSWLVWRQHRQEAALLVALLVLLGVGLVIADLKIAAWASQVGLGDCLTRYPGGSCRQQVLQFGRAFLTLDSLVMALNLLPPLAGIFLAAPLVAREVERGTHRLAWTQSVTRGRWLTGHTAAVLGMVLVAAAVIQVALNQIMAPVLDANDLTGFSGGRFAPLMFDAVGIVPVAYALFAVALGFSCGALVRRTLGAMVLMLVLFAGVRVSVASLARPSYLPAVTRTAAVESTRATGVFYTPPGAFVTSFTFLGPDGAPTYMPTCNPPRPGCFDRFTVTYQPRDHFWPFQLIESGIYLALSVPLLGATWLLVRRQAG
jgi:hypothetical protein